MASTLSLVHWMSNELKVALLFYPFCNFFVFFSFSWRRRRRRNGKKSCRGGDRDTELEMGRERPKVLCVVSRIYSRSNEGNAVPHRKGTTLSFINELCRYVQQEQQPQQFFSFSVYFMRQGRGWMWVACRTETRDATHERHESTGKWNRWKHTFHQTYTTYTYRCLYAQFCGYRITWWTLSLVKHIVLFFCFCLGIVGLLFERNLCARARAVSFSMNISFIV